MNLIEEVIQAFDIQCVACARNVRKLAASVKPQQEIESCHDKGYWTKAADGYTLSKTLAAKLDKVAARRREESRLEESLRLDDEDHCPLCEEVLNEDGECDDCDGVA